MNYIRRGTLPTKQHKTDTMSTLDILEVIVNSDPTISNLTFYKYPKQVLLQNALCFGSVEDEQLKDALLHRSKTKMPFWDSVMLTFFNRNPFSRKILEAATKHNKNWETIKTRNIRRIRDMIANDKDINLSINSTISFQDNQKHIFLLDFHIPPADSNLMVVKNILQILNLTGYILNSGKSYHFIGKDYLTEDELITLLAKALFFAPIVDRAWIGHQLIERSCSIRVGYKNGKLPVLASEV